jgi:hypothetical protein
MVCSNVIYIYVYNTLFLEKVIDSSLSAQNSFHSWSTTNGFISPLTNAVIQKTSRVISPTFLPSLVNTMSIICKKISSELFWANVYIGSITRMYFNKKGLGTLDFTKSSIESDTNGWDYTLLHIVTTSLMSCLLLRLLSSCGLHLLPYSSVKKSFQNDIKDLATSLAQLEKNFSKETKRSASVHERLLKAIDNDMYVFPNENQSTEAKSEFCRSSTCAFLVQKEFFSSRGQFSYHRGLFKRVTELCESVTRTKRGEW